MVCTATCSGKDAWHYSLICVVCGSFTCITWPMVCTSICSGAGNIDVEVLLSSCPGAVAEDCCFEAQICWKMMVRSSSCIYVCYCVYLYCEKCVHIHVLQCVAVCCSVLQCVAVCCSVFQYYCVYLDCERNVYIYIHTHTVAEDCCLEVQLCIER